jgi:phenylpyruvate tautomerase PptA (4-oxalocrotonate tautomerase family)
VPVVTIRCRPKSDGQRERVAERIIETVAAEFELPADRVQVFFDEYDDTHWFRGPLPVEEG